MFRFIVPIILIGVALAGFVILTSPLYQEISLKRGEIASYNEALDNSKALENERDKLTKKYNSITPENLEKLQKLLPNNVDNIRLILEIEKVAGPYGMLLKDIKYSPEQKEDKKNTGATTQESVAPGALNNNYGTWDLEFSTQGSYTNFINFLKDLENNLRIVDISSIAFSSDTGGGSSLSPLEVYRYSFKIKTYWLKN